MNYIRTIYNFINENHTYDNNFVHNICVAMVLLNNTFLDDLLDRGMVNRYTKDSKVFLNDLHVLLMKKNRLRVGNLIDGKIVEDEVSNINKIFNSNIEFFDIKTYWNKLISARETARNIIDKIIPDDKLNPDMIEHIYLCSSDDSSVDFIIKTHIGTIYPIILNKKFNTTKSKSISNIIDNIAPDNKEKLFSDIYLDKWNKIAQEWVRIIYQYSNNKYRMYIEQFINPDRFGSVTYSNFFDIKIRDEKYKILGYNIPELNKHYVNLSDLLSDIYERKEAFTDYNKAKSEWLDVKKYNLNSSILQDFFENATDLSSDVEKTPDNLILAKDKVKMNMMKVIVELLGLDEDEYHYFSKTSYYKVPSRQFYRDNYDKFEIFYDLHNELSNSESKSNYSIKFNLNYNREYIMGIIVDIGFSGGEMSGKLSAKYSLDIPLYFNYKLK